MAVFTWRRNKGVGKKFWYQIIIYDPQNIKYNDLAWEFFEKNSKMFSQYNEDLEFKFAF